MGQTGSTIISKEEKLGALSDLSEIIPNKLYLSSRYPASDPYFLKGQGFSHVLSLTQKPLTNYRHSTDDKGIARTKPSYSTSREGIKNLHFSIDDTPEADIRSTFAEGHTFINEGGNLKCLVHCEAGISRSATMVISYMMKKDNLTPLQGYELVKGKRKRISPNNGFFLELIKYSELVEPKPYQFLAEYLVLTQLKDVEEHGITLEMIRQSLVDCKGKVYATQTQIMNMINIRYKNQKDEEKMEEEDKTKLHNELENEEEAKK